MDLLKEILDTQNNDSVSSMARSFGLRDDQVTAALESLVPALAQGLQRNTASPSGMESLAAALGKGHHQRYVDNPWVLNEPETVNDGNGILGHILGSKDASREVARNAAGRSGISADILKKMLPIVAALVMGQLSRKANGGRSNAGAGASGGLGGLGGVLGSLLR